MFKVKNKYSLPPQNVMLRLSNGFLVRGLHTGPDILPNSLSDLLPKPRLSHVNRVFDGFLCVCRGKETGYIDFQRNMCRIVAES